MRARAVFAAGLTTLLVAACSGGPEKPRKVEHDKALPTCEAFPNALTALGMNEPTVQPPSLTGLAPTGFDCVFAPAAKLQAAGVGAVSVMVIRPDTDPYGGQPVATWGEQFVTSSTCDGQRRADPAVPHGTVCYTQVSANSGQATLLGFARGSAMRVTVQWFDPAATGTGLQATAEQKAGTLTQTLVAML